MAFSTAPEEVHLRLLKLRPARARNLARPAPVREVDGARHRRPSRRGSANRASIPEPEERAVRREAQPGSHRCRAGASRPRAGHGRARPGVWVSLGRPIFFRQARTGRDGRVFEAAQVPLDAPARGTLRLCRSPARHGARRVEGEDRRTRVGAFLRRTSIDELPQLWNVLKGEMSLVGPRPERPEYVDLFSGNIYRYGERHRVKAGITGLGSGARPSGPDVAGGPRRVGQLLHRELVALARLQDHALDAVRSRSLGRVTPHLPRNSEANDQRRPGIPAERKRVTRRGLVANGDPRDLATFSNIPHFFLKAGSRTARRSRPSAGRGLHEALNLERALRPVTLDRPRAGCTPDATRARSGLAARLKARWRNTSATSNCYRLENEVREPITYYIDATMRQWFEDWVAHRTTRGDALAREREAYLSSRCVVPPMVGTPRRRLLVRRSAKRRRFARYFQAREPRRRVAPPAGGVGGELS